MTLLLVKSEYGLVLQLSQRREFCCLFWLSFEERGFYSISITAIPTSFFSGFWVFIGTLEQRDKLTSGKPNVFFLTGNFCVLFLKGPTSS